MFLHRRFVPALAIYSYMVGDETSGRCAVIDPTRDVEPYMRLAREQGLRITDILEPHVHADFISGAPQPRSRPRSTSPSAPTLRRGQAGCCPTNPRSWP